MVVFLISAEQQSESVIPLEISAPLDSFCILVLTEYLVEFPVVYSRSLQVIYFIYSSVYMSHYYI